MELGDGLADPLKVDTDDDGVAELVEPGAFHIAGRANGGWQRCFDGLDHARLKRLGRGREASLLLGRGQVRLHQIAERRDIIPNVAQGVGLGLGRRAFDHPGDERADRGPSFSEHIGRVYHRHGGICHPAANQVFDSGGQLGQGALEDDLRRDAVEDGAEQPRRAVCQVLQAAHFLGDARLKVGDGVRAEADVRERPGRQRARADLLAGVGETVDAADQLGHRVVTRHLIGDRLRIHVGEMPRRADDRHEGKEILLGGENNRVEKLAVRGAAHEDAETAKLEKESVTLSPAMRPRDGAQIVTPLPYLGTIQRHTHPCRRGVHLLARILATGPSSLLPCGQCTDTTGSVCVPRVEHLRFARGSPATQRLTRTVRTNHQRAHNPSGSNGV